MPKIVKKRLSFVEIAEYLGDELGVPRETIFAELISVAERNGFSFLVPRDLQQHRKPAFLGGVTARDGVRLDSALIIDEIRRLSIPSNELNEEAAHRRIHVSVMAGLLAENGFTNIDFETREGALYRSAKNTEGLSVEEFFVGNLLFQRVRPFLTDDDFTDLKMNPSANDRLQHVFRQVFLDRETFLRWCRLVDGGAVGLPSTKLAPRSFWGDPWKGQPTDWMSELPAVYHNQDGLLLGDALKRYSDPSVWARYELISSDNTTEIIKQREELKRGFEQHLRQGRLVARGYAMPVSMEAPPIYISRDKADIGEFNYEFSTFKLDSLELRGVRIFKPEEVNAHTTPPLSEPKPYMPSTAPSANTGGRPQKFDWEAFLIEVVRIANTPDGLPPRKAELVTMMLSWCTDNWNESPGESTVRERVRRVYDTLNITTET